MGGRHAEPLKVGIRALSTTRFASGRILIGRKITDYVIVISMIILSVGLVERGCFWPAEVLSRRAVSPCASAVFCGATPTKKAFIDPRLSDMAIEPISR